MSVTYLSDEWITEANTLLAATVVDPPIPDPGMCLETVISDAGARIPSGYVVEFRGSTMSARRSRPDESATVRFVQRYEVAAAVAQGRLSAQAAFLAADIQLGGDVSMLIARSGLMGLIGDALAPLRSRTVYADA